MITDIDYTNRLEENVKQLQNMAIDISRQNQKRDAAQREEWTKTNKDMFTIPEE